MNDHNSYKPTENEEYMNPSQLLYFRERLLNWRKELLSTTKSSRNDLKETNGQAPDLFDVASKNIDLAIDIEDMERRGRDIVLIDKALSRINSGEYGYCDLSGEEIGIRRLDAQPTATLCIQVQEMLERNSQMNRPCRPIECFV